MATTALVANLVHMTSTTTGTGNQTLAAVNGKQTFNSAFGTGGTNVFYYFISNQSAAEWEVGTGHLSASTTLVRDTVLDGSSGTSAVNFSAGTKDITSAMPYKFVRGVAPGDIITTFDETIDTGFVELDGSTITGGATSYPIVATRYSWMVSGSNLVLPDLRGIFLRSWAHGSANDPDAASRTARVGGTTGDHAGTNQAYAVESHDHSQTYIPQNASLLASGSSILYNNASTTTTGSYGGNETRPININVTYQMKVG